MLPTNPGTYVALELTATTRSQLDEFVNTQLQLSAPVDPAYYHTTVIYSDNPVPAADNLPKEYTATATGIKYALFKTKQGGQCLTILVESYQARALNNYLTAEGASSSYPTYTPHLTLSYDYVGGDITKLPLPSFPIQYDKILVKPLDPTFVPPTSARAPGR